MSSSNALEKLILGLGLCALACADSGSNTDQSAPATDTGQALADTGDDGDGDGDPSQGDGDGVPSQGDGDGAPGDGDGDGDGAPGDGDGDGAPGDGDGDGEPVEGLCAGPCGSPDCGSCPDAPMVDTNWFFIDATEVTVADYVEFAALEFHPVVLSSQCLWKLDSGWFTPTDWEQQMMGDPKLPVRGVDWCDAEAYCEWAGKRLCGLVGGGPAQLGELAQPPNEWFRACSNGGIQNYPYGNDYQQLACNGEDLGIESLAPVGSIPECQGGVEGVFDMSGNVWEWTNACGDDPNEQPWTQECRRRGGSFYSPGPLLRCGVDSLRHRGFRDNNTGIRCCAD